MRNGLLLSIVASMLLVCAQQSLADSAIQQRLREKSQAVMERIPAWIAQGGSSARIQAMGKSAKQLALSGKPLEAEQRLDQMLALLASPIESSIDGKPSAFREFEVRGGVSGNGIYDPSLEYDHSGVGWMAYSWVKFGAEAVVATHIARSDDRGRSWSFITEVNGPRADALPLEEGKPVHGVWWNEVASLLYDPNDVGREWKLFWHKYFSKMPHRGPHDRRFEYGWIAYRYASHPSGPWSEEEALLGTGKFLKSPFRTRISLGDLHPDLKRYVVLTEPGTLRIGDTIFLSLQAARKRVFRAPAFDILLLKSDDHGKSWEYVNTLLDSSQASDFGGDGFTGTSLVIENGRKFLFVCPEVHDDSNSGHRGTVIFEFEDIFQGSLKQNSNGRPAVVKWLKPDLSKGGQSDYDQQNSNGGIVMPQFDSANFPRPFRIYATGERIIEN